MNLFSKIILPAFLAISLFSCGKKDDPAPAGNGSVKIEVFNNVGSGELNLNNQWYVNQHGDSFKVSKFNYYISNIKLNGASTTYTESESYHLVQQSETASKSISLTDVTQGTYTGITFTIGVDSLRNVSGAQTGALDAANGMFWTWNTGYIMLKLEGTSPKSTQPNNALIFHAGGFTGANSAVRTVTVNFPSAITVAAAGTNHIHLVADVLALFKSPNVFDFSTTSSIQAEGAEVKKLADNYANMFSVSFAGL